MMATAGDASQSHGVTARTTYPTATQHTAHRKQLRLSQSRDQCSGSQRVDQRADAERRNGDADQPRTDAEPLMQMGADIGKRPEHQHAFEKGGAEQDARPGPLQDIACCQRSFAPARTPWHRHADGEPPHFDRQQGAGNKVRDAEKQQCPTPADEFTEYAAGSLTEDDAQDLAGGEARQNRLATLVGDHVAEPGNGQRNDGRSANAGQEAQQGKLRQPVHEGARHRGYTGPNAPEHHHAQLALRITQRPNDDLEQAVRHREGSNDCARFTYRRAQLAGNLRQQRIAYPQVRGADEACDRQENDSAHGRFGLALIRAHERITRATTASNAFLRFGIMTEFGDDNSSRSLQPCTATHMPVLCRLSPTATVPRIHTGTLTCNPAVALRRGDSSGIANHALVPGSPLPLPLPFHDRRRQSVGY